MQKLRSGQRWCLLRGGKLPVVGAGRHSSAAAGEHCGGKEVCGSQRTQLLRIFRKTSLCRVGGTLSHPA